MDDTYHVLLDTGQEGPFTRDELRERLALGKVRSADRVTEDRTKKITSILEIITDAGDISKSRVAATERIRRKSSDRHRVAQQASDRLRAAEALAPAIAAAVQPIDIPLLVETPVEVVAGVGQSSAQRRNIRVASDPRLRFAIGTLSVMIIIAVGWMLFPSFDKSLTMADVVGTWHAVAESATPELAEITLEFQSNQLVLTDHGATRAIPCEIRVSDPEGLVLELSVLDPLLGTHVQMQLDDAVLYLMTQKGVVRMSKD